MEKNQMHGASGDALEAYHTHIKVPVKDDDTPF
jgi:hypothetical protein